MTKCKHQYQANKPEPFDRCALYNGMPCLCTRLINPSKAHCEDYEPREENDGQNSSSKES